MNVISQTSTQGSRLIRKLDKERFGDDIAKKLNSATPSPRALRIKRLIELLQMHFEKIAELESICRERHLMAKIDARLIFGGRKPLADYDLSDPTVSELADQIIKNANEIDLLFGRYSGRSGVHVNNDGTLQQYTHCAYADEEAIWEYTTGQWLSSRLPASPAANFLHCERCGDWFFAGRDGAKFCRRSCSEMSRQQTDEGRAARARYMRGLRAQKRDRKLKRLKPS